METMLRTGVEQCPKTLGLQNVVIDLRKSCLERLNISEDFVNASVLNNAGSEIMNKIRYELIMISSIKVMIKIFV